MRHLDHQRYIIDLLIINSIFYWAYARTRGSTQNIKYVVAQKPNFRILKMICGYPYGYK